MKKRLIEYDLPLADISKAKKNPLTGPARATIWRTILVFLHSANSLLHQANLDQISFQ